jgi:hypothetical protein
LGEKLTLETALKSSQFRCAQELLRKAKSENITIEVDLFEARDRVGGRCHTDRTSFKTPDGKDFPIELGACWVSLYYNFRISLCAYGMLMKSNPISNHN